MAYLSTPLDFPGKYTSLPDFASKIPDCGSPAPKYNIIFYEPTRIYKIYFCEIDHNAQPDSECWTKEYQ